MNIRSSMYHMVSLFIAIPFLLFSIIISYIYNNNLEKVITESLQSVANVQVAEMTSFCQQQIDNLTIIGNIDASYDALQGTLDASGLIYLNNMLYSQVHNMSFLKSVAFVDINNNVVACSEEDYSIIARDGIDKLITYTNDEAVYITDVVTAKKLNGEEYKTVVAIVRIEDKDKILGHVLCEINLDFYDDIRRQAELWDNSTFYLMDGNSQIISAGSNMENRDSFVTTNNERENYNKKYKSIDFEKNPTGSFTYRLRGKSYITYYSNVQNTNWRFLLTVNLDSYFANRIIYGVMVIMLVLLCSILALWIGSFTSKRIVNPVKRISCTLRNIQERQDYSLRVSVNRNDELGGLSSEINELLNFTEKQQLLLHQKAERDALTKVLNKEMITQYLQKTIEYHHTAQTQLAVLFIDVDDFKSFNTEYGHDVGDQVLLFVASLLEKETKGTVGRVGGDEFLVVVQEPESIQKLEQCLDNVRELAHSQFIVRETSNSIPIACCIGAVWVDFKSVNKTELTGDSLIKLADEAMYEVKNSCKGGYIVRVYDEKDS